MMNGYEYPCHYTWPHIFGAVFSLVNSATIEYCWWKTFFLNISLENVNLKYQDAHRPSSKSKFYRMAVRFYLINNAFLVQKELLILCENVAARWAYKIYYNGTEGLLNQ